MRTDLRFQEESCGYHSVAPGLPYSTRYVWYVIFLLCSVNICNYIDRMALAVLAPLIKVDLKLSDAQLGLLTGFSFALFYAACAIPIARWADRGTRRDIIALALATWSVMTALSGAAQNFLHMFLTRVGVGAGEAGSFAPGASIICDYVPVKRRSTALAVHTFGNAAGLLIGMAVAGTLGEMIGWRWTFLVLGLPGILLAVLVRLSLREPARGFFDGTHNDKTHPSLYGVMSFLWRCRTYRLLTFFFVANGFVQFGLNQWLPSFYARIFGIDLTSVGIYLGVAIGSGLGIGMLLGGFLASRSGQRDARGLLRVGALFTSLAVPAALGSLWIPWVPGSVGLVWLSGILWGISNGPVMASAYSVVMPHMRATAGAVSILFTSVLGFGLGPVCVGLLSDLLTPLFGDEGLRYALHLPICLTPAMILALLGAASTLRADFNAVSASSELDSLPESHRYNPRRSDTLGR